MTLDYRKWQNLSTLCSQRKLYRPQF